MVGFGGWVTIFTGTMPSIAHRGEPGRDAVGAGDQQAGDERYGGRGLYRQDRGQGEHDDQRTPAPAGARTKRTPRFAARP